MGCRKRRMVSEGARLVSCIAAHPPFARQIDNDFIASYQASYGMHTITEDQRADQSTSAGATTAQKEGVAAGEEDKGKKLVEQVQHVAM